MRSPRRFRISVLRPAVGAALVALSVGCGSAEKRSPVTGRVTNAGQAVTAASVVFQQPETGIHVAAELDDEGRYRVMTAQGEGLPPGSYTIAIVPASLEEAGPVDPRSVVPGDTPARSDIPEQFQSARSSGLRFQVAEGDNRFDIDLGAEHE